MKISESHCLNPGAFLKPYTRPVFKNIILFLSSGTFLGYLPLAPGTFGTLWGIPLAFWLAGYTLGFQISFIVCATVISVYLADRAEKIWVRKDPSRVVIDEIMGYLVTMVGLPFSWKTAMAGFFIFRFMDILKPFPIRNIDRSLPGGWGIVLDDVLAGVYSQILLRLGLFLLMGK
jgi:phosphatidylglycerophosphatase A